MARTSRDQEQLIIEAYEAWDPAGDETVAALVERLGTNRQTFYKVLERNGIPTKRAGDAGTRIVKQATSLNDKMAEIALAHLVDDLVGCRTWIEDVCEAVLKHLSKPGTADSELRQLLAHRP